MCQAFSTYQMSTIEISIVRIMQEDSGECAFLILDPHYTGTDNVKDIHAGERG
jgi:hypothetical protein